MQPVVASLQLALLFAAPVHAGVYAPSLPHDKSGENFGIVIIHPASGQHAKTGAMQSNSCRDDSTWVDEDGDGCAAYASAIKEGHLSRDVACGFKLPGVADVIESGDPAGAAAHCRSTCGTCHDPEIDTVPSTLSKGDSTSQECVDDPLWKDEDGDGCDVYQEHINAGDITQAMACGFEAVDDKLLLSGSPNGAAEHCRATCGTCAMASEMIETSQNNKFPGQAILPSFTAPESEETKCVDDPSWVDMDGDGCAVYAEAIASGEIAQEQACGRLHANLLSGNPSEAAKYCPLTCGNCPLEGYREDNDREMKDLIRYLVEVESELILESASDEEPEKEDTSDVTTTTTTAAKRLPEAEVPSNATWVVYSAPEEEVESMELSRMDLLKMVEPFAMPQQSFKHLI